MHLDDLEKKHHKRQRFSFRGSVKEIRIFLMLFFVVVIVMLVVTNLNLFASSFQSLFDGTVPQIQNVDKNSIYENKDINSILAEAGKDSEEIQALLKRYQSGREARKFITSSEESILRSKLRDYPFDFNTLPPVKKMLIPSLGLDAPIISPQTMTATDFIKANFDKELTSGVVKYPTTPDPGTPGNSLIFGHTSQEFRKHNPYGTIFKTLPKLVNGDLIKIIWDGNLYEYKVVDKFIVVPSQVNAQYMSYQNAGGSYITLMGCYPLGTDKKRIMVVAKLVE